MSAAPSGHASLSKPIDCKYGAKCRRQQLALADGGCAFRHPGGVAAQSPAQLSVARGREPAGSPGAAAPGAQHDYVDGGDVPASRLARVAPPAQATAAANSSSSSSVDSGATSVLPSCVRISAAALYGYSRTASRSDANAAALHEAALCRAQRTADACMRRVHAVWRRVCEAAAEAVAGAGASAESVDVDAAARFDAGGVDVCWYEGVVPDDVLPLSQRPELACTDEAPSAHDEHDEAAGQSPVPLSKIGSVWFGPLPVRAQHALQCALARTADLVSVDDEQAHADRQARHDADEASDVRIDVEVPCRVHCARLPTSLRQLQLRMALKLALERFGVVQRVFVPVDKSKRGNVHLEYVGVVY